jgi:putative heme-binding domain-containing protein
MSNRSLIFFYVFAIISPMVAAVVGATVSFPLTTDTIKVARGVAVFQANCKQCHARSANSASLMGPSLHDIGAVAGKRVSGQSAVEYLWASVVEPNRFLAGEGAMPTTFGSTLSNDELRDLVAYLQTLGGKPNYREILGMEPLKVNAREQELQKVVSVDQIKQGRSLFFGRFNCHTCHSTLDMPGGGLVAPTLHGVGHFSKEHLKSSIRAPSKSVSPRYALVQSLTIDGEAINGILLSRNDHELVLASGSQKAGLEIVRLSPSDLEMLGDDIVRPAKGSLMPEWTEALMTETELDAIVSYLQTLK